MQGVGGGMGTVRERGSEIAIASVFACVWGGGGGGACGRAVGYVHFAPNESLQKKEGGNL